MTQSADQTVYWFLEQQNVTLSTPRGKFQVDSWSIFYNPAEGRQVFSGSIGFDRPIVDLFTTQQQLVNSDEFSRPGALYDYSLRYVGLEQGDRERTSFVGGALSIGQWASGEPGDYIRVLTVTAVPEPAAAALLLAGLLLVSRTTRRNRG